MCVYMYIYIYGDDIYIYTYNACIVDVYTEIVYVMPTVYKVYANAFYIYVMCM